MKFRTMVYQVIFLALTAYAQFSLNGTFPDSYNPQKQIPIFVGRVEKEAPFQYFDYTSLPICDFYGVENDKLTGIDGGLGPRLLGHTWVFDPRVPIIFQEDLENTSVCKLSMTSDVVRETGRLVRDGARVTYWIDGLPAVAYLGHERSGLEYLYKHRHFDIVYKGDKIVAVDVVPSEPQQLILNARMELTYSVKFTDVDTMEDSDETVDRRYERYLTLLEGDAKNKSRIDAYNLVNAGGFMVIVASMAGMVFERFLRSRKSTEEESSWSVTANMPNLSMLRNQVYRRPKHAILISVLVGLGAQAIVAFIALSIYTSAFLSESERVFFQLDGRIMNPAMASFVGASWIGGLAGGNFVKAWGIRRHGLAFLSQIGLPFSIAAIVLIQYRTVSLLVGTTLAWSILDCFYLTGLALVNAIGHCIGFVVAHWLTNTLEATTPKTADEVPQVAEAPAEGRLTRAVLLCISPILVALITAGPLYYVFSCATGSFCVQDNLFNFEALIVCSWILMSCSMVIVSFLLLCLGDGRWQWNAARSGVWLGIIQTVLFVFWGMRSDRMSSMYSAAMTFGVNCLLGCLTACASTTVSYYSSSAILLTIYDGKKTE